MTNIMPFFPEFSDARKRNAWIRDNADYFTVVRRVKKSYERTEVPTLTDAITTAQSLIHRDQDRRYLIYAVYQVHDALVATVSKDKVTYHEG